MKKNIKDNITQQLNTNIDDLYIIIGLELSDTISITTQDISKIIEKGKLYFDKNLLLFKKVICNNQQIVLLSSSKDFEDKILLVSAIADLISSIIYNISPITVATLIVKFGIDNLCSKEYNKTLDDE